MCCCRALGFGLDELLGLEQPGSRGSVSVVGGFLRQGVQRTVDVVGEDPAGFAGLAGASELRHATDRDDGGVVLLAIAVEEGGAREQAGNDDDDGRDQCRWRKSSRSRIHRHAAR